MTETPFKIKGPLPGTPEFYEVPKLDPKTKKQIGTERLPVTISGICAEGRHELELDPEGYVIPGQCRGGGRWKWGKPWFCGCACHRYIRGLTPDTREFDFPIDRERDPLQPTLAEELREWARARESERPRLGPVVPVVVPTVTADSISDNGRRMRGALELQVLDICQKYDSGELLVDDGLLTTLAVSEAVAKEYGCTPPSQGAVHYVWTGWEEIDFAWFGKKPYRFMTFTDVGKTIGLEQLKERARKSTA